MRVRPPAPDARWMTFALATVVAGIGAPAGPLAAQASPEVSVEIGVGQALGGIGASVELASSGGRVAAFGSIGYTPDLEFFSDGDDGASRMRWAAGIRVFAATGPLRPFVEAAWASRSESTEVVFDGPDRTTVHYALALSGGLRWAPAEFVWLQATLGRFVASVDDDVGENRTAVSLGVGFPVG